MTNRILALLLLLISCQFSSFGGIVKRADGSYSIETEEHTEKNGFKWTELSTRHGPTGLLSCGAYVNGKEIIPLLSGYGHIKFFPLAPEKGVFCAEILKYDTPYPYPNVFFDIDGNKIYQTIDFLPTACYDNQKGLYIDFYDGDENYYFNPPRDASGRIINNGTNGIEGESTNNDKYSYGRYVSAKMNNSGTPIAESCRYVYPEDRDNGYFEIRFSYLKNSDNSYDQTFPLAIYLNEINDKGEIVKSELIGHLIGKLNSSVQFKSDGVDIFTPKYHIHVHSDGKIMLYETKNGSYANGVAQLFMPTEYSSVIYGVRYDVLIDKLKKIVN